MIFKWLEHQEIKHDEKAKLLLLLYDLGGASERQICHLTGWSHSKFHYVLTQIKRKSPTKEERKLWVKSERTNYTLDKSIYMLEKSGMKHVANILQLPGTSIREDSEAQSEHTLGITDILLRFLEVNNNNSIQWYGTKEATDLLYRMVRTINPDIQKRKLPRPDAYALFLYFSCWIEYDRSTESPLQIEEKYIDYVENLNLIGNTWTDSTGKQRKPLNSSPVVWVTVNEGRRRLLEQTWKQLVRLRYSGGEVPKMYFFTTGEETPFFIQHNSKKD